MLGKLAELFLFGLGPLVFGGLMIPGAFAAEEITISGEVFYRERIALPPNAVLTVRLSDVSLADAPEAVIAEQKIDPAGQVPIKFEIKLDPAVVRPNVNYALQARIAVDNGLWFINDERYTVDPLKPEPVQLMLKMVKQDTGSAPTLLGTNWLAEDINGGGVIDNAQSTFSVASTARLQAMPVATAFSRRPKSRATRSGSARPARP
jgi:putative lipoprotein